MTGAPRSPGVVIAGGGTGGHVFPALAIKQAIVRRRPDADVTFVGTRRGLEARILPAAGERIEFLWISGFSRSHLLRNVTLPAKLISSAARSYFLLKRRRPQVVIGTGGYVMGPVLWMAQKMGIPTILQEQNSYPGITTRSLAPRADVVCLGFAAARPRLRARRIEVTGNPVRADFGGITRAAARAEWNVDERRKTVLVFGGSAGAQSINDAVGAALEELCRACNVIWQTGKSGVPAAVSGALLQRAAADRHLVVRDFIGNMASACAAADLAVCRAGALTLAELAITGLPAILIPYPYAADDHQTANAQAVVAAGGALLIADRDLAAARLADVIASILADESRLPALAAGMKRLAYPDAADRIAAIALTAAGLV